MFTVLVQVSKGVLPEKKIISFHKRAGYILYFHVFEVVPLLWIIFVIFVSCLSCFLIWLLQPCGHLLEKGWSLVLLCVMFNLVLSLFKVASWVRYGT